jgi:hypothetical protein
MAGLQPLQLGHFPTLPGRGCHHTAVRVKEKGTITPGVRDASGPRTGLSPTGADFEFPAIEPPFGLT